MILCALGGCFWGLVIGGTVMYFIGYIACGLNMRKDG